MEEISIGDFIKYILRNWMVVVGATLLGFIGGYIYNLYIQEPLYKSTATMLLVNKPNDGSNVTSLANNYSELFKSRSVLGSAKDTLDYDISYETMLARTTSSVSSGTEVINVSIAASDPQDSHDLMVAALAAFQSEMMEIYGVDYIDVVDTASLPDQSYNVNYTTQLLLAGAAGFTLSMLILFFAFDSSVAGRGGGSSSSRRGSEESDDVDEVQVEDRPRAVRTRQRDSSKIILGDSDDISESFLFDDEFLEEIATRSAKTGAIKKPGSRYKKKK